MALKIFTAQDTDKRSGSDTYERDGRLEYRVARVKGVDYAFIRVGAVVAQRAGLRERDKVIFGVDDETGFGVIKADPKGWSLQSANKSKENPPLTARITFRKDWPYYPDYVAMDKVIARNRSLEFYFPQGVRFGIPDGEEVPNEEEVEEGALAPRKSWGVPEEVYQEHKEIVEKELPRRKKREKKAEERPMRRESDKAPQMKNGKPYGRRKGDRV